MNIEFMMACSESYAKGYRDAKLIHNNKEFDYNLTMDVAIAFHMWFVENETEGSLPEIFGEWFRKYAYVME